jgi:divinyl protochlorophyllide a 8-vinyl-reductase
MTTRLVENLLENAGPAISRIGPNAVTQLIAALRLSGQSSLAGPIFAEAGALDWLTDPPEDMVDERPVGRLHRSVRAVLPVPEATVLLREAGRLTANYLLAARIPRLVQFVLRCLPPRLAAAVLVPAIRAHAWTFAGSGRFTAHIGSPTVFEVTDNPLCRDEHAPACVCAWHAAVFERLFQALVSPQTHVTETSCAARGDAQCRFVADWRATG